MPHPLRTEVRGEHCPPPALPAGVGRLVPATGVVVRAHPDRQLLDHVLDELRLPLANAQALLELLDAGVLTPAAGAVVRSVGDAVDHALQLAVDFREFTRLEADAVRPQPAPVDPVAWLAGCVARQAERALQYGIELSIAHRSFVPDRVVFDAEVAASAVDAVLRVALRRALGPRVELQVVYEPAVGAGDGGAAGDRLAIQVGTSGGGFADLEQGYACAPLVARDRDDRGLLGLCIAQRWCRLLGGDLEIGGTSSAACSYRLTFAAPPGPGARWMDPVARRRLGPVHPGRLLFVGVAADEVLLCAPVLRRAGYTIDVLAGFDGLRDAGAAVAPWSAMVVTEALATAAASLPSLGDVPTIVATAARPSCQEPAGACDRIVRPIAGDDLLRCLRQLHHTAAR
jgi:hypothetical protein